MPLPIITSTVTTQDFVVLLEQNPGLVIAKFGAEWCGPCKRIEEIVQKCMGQMPTTIQCLVLDVDESFELYAFLKSKKIVTSIPTIVCYEKGNTSYIPNDVVVGADHNQINIFFGKAFNKGKALLAQI
jgi:thioredoxin 1